MAVAQICHSKRYHRPVIVLTIGQRLHETACKVKKPQSSGNVMGITDLSPCCAKCWLVIGRLFFNIHIYIYTHTYIKIQSAYQILTHFS